MAVTPKELEHLQTLSKAVPQTAQGQEAAAKVALEHELHMTDRERGRFEPERFEDEEEDD